MRIAVAGGKGGTGKTLLAVCLTEYLAGKSTFLLDADVEEPDAGLFFQHTSEQRNEVYSMIPKIDMEKCTLCGYCAQICQFNALVIIPEEVLLYPELCHSCLACYHLCPQAAISHQYYSVGEIDGALLSNGCSLRTGRLKVGEPRSVSVINAVKAHKLAADWEIIDCPPGTSCSLLESIKETDYCLLVTEPTPFGRHDLALALEATRLGQIQSGVVINRWQGDDGGIDLLASENCVPLLARIPYDEQLARVYARGENPQLLVPWLSHLMGQIVAGIKGEVKC